MPQLYHFWKHSLERRAQLSAYPFTSFMHMSTQNSPRGQKSNGYYGFRRNITHAVLCGISQYSLFISSVTIHSLLISSELKQNKALILYFFLSRMVCYPHLLQPSLSGIHIPYTYSDIYFLFIFHLRVYFSTSSPVYFNHLLSNALTVWLPWSYHAWWAARASSNNKSQLQPFLLFWLPLVKAGRLTLSLLQLGGIYEVCFMFSQH